MENITLGFAMCGSFCTFDPVLTALEALKAQYPDIIPILSPASASFDKFKNFMVRGDTFKDLIRALPD